MWFRGMTTWPEKGTETGHVVQGEGPHGRKWVHMPSMWFYQKTMVPEAGHGRAGKDPLPNKKPG